MIKYDNIGLNPVCTAAGVYILYVYISYVYIYMHALWRFPKSWGYPKSSKSWMTTTCKPMVTWGSPIFEHHGAGSMMFHVGENVIKSIVLE